MNAYFGGMASRDRLAFHLDGDQLAEPLAA